MEAMGGPWKHLSYLINEHKLAGAWVQALWRKTGMIFHSGSFVIEDPGQNLLTLL